jgi:ubiquinone/menaquinone biosynthesis C-methylase UbiE
MDVRAMEMPDSCFDLIIDKGLFDAQLCGEDNLNGVTTMVAEISRVLKPGGAYVVVSHGKPAARLGYLQKRELQWDVQVLEIPKNAMEGQDDGPSPCYYMYTCRKLHGSGGAGR